MVRGASGDEGTYLGVRVQSAFGCSAEKASLSDPKKVKKQHEVRFAV